MALNSKNHLPNITVRSMCSAFPVCQREAGATTASTGKHWKMLLFSEYPLWSAKSFPGTTQNCPWQWTPPV